MRKHNVMLTPLIAFRFGAGVSAADLTVSAAIGSDGNAALAIRAGNGGQVVIDGGLDGAIDNFAFTDSGTTLTLDQMMAQANTGATTVAGANGNVIFSGVGNGIAMLAPFGLILIYGEGRPSHRCRGVAANDGIWVYAA